MGLRLIEAHIPEDMPASETVPVPGAVHGPRNNFLVLEGSLGATSLVLIELKLVPFKQVGTKLILRGVNQECDQYRIAARLYCVSETTSLQASRQSVDCVHK